MTKIVLRKKLQDLLQIYLTLKIKVWLILQITSQRKELFQEHKERDLAVREKVNEMATQYVDQFIVGNYPKHKIFNKEDISIFETIARMH